MVDEDQVVKVIAFDRVADQLGDKLDCAFIHLGRAGLDRHAIDKVLAGDDINADVFDGPLLIISSDVVEIGALVSNTSLDLVTKTVLTTIVLISDSRKSLLGPAVLESVRVPGNGNGTSEVADDILIVTVAFLRVELLVLCDFVPTTIETALAERRFAINFGVRAGALVGASVRSSPEKAHRGNK